MSNDSNKKTVRFSDNIHIYSYTYYNYYETHMSIRNASNSTSDIALEKIKDSSSAGVADNNTGSDARPFCGTFHCSQLRFLECSICNPEGRNKWW